MTDRAYKAKDWLNRNYHLSKQLDADVRLMNTLADRVNNCIGQYERDGTESHDPERSKAHHEDMLLEYSEQKKKVENLTAKLNAEDRITRRAIDAMSNPELIAVAIDRYINRLKWEDIATLEHLSPAEVYRRHRAMLDAMGAVLATTNF